MLAKNVIIRKYSDRMYNDKGDREIAIVSITIAGNLFGNTVSFSINDVTLFEIDGARELNLYKKYYAQNGEKKNYEIFRPLNNNYRAYLLWIVEYAVDAYLRRVSSYMVNGSYDLSVTERTFAISDITNKVAVEECFDVNM